MLKKNMSVLLTIFGLSLSLSLSLSSIAAAFEYPTLWDISNNSSEMIVIQCQGQAYGLSRPITFGPTQVNPGAAINYTWHGWYNDGLGLNSANWSCTLNSNNGSKRGQGNFFTGMGENIRLTIQPRSNGLIVYKE